MAWQCKNESELGTPFARGTQAHKVKRSNSEAPLAAIQSSTASSASSTTQPRSTSQPTSTTFSVPIPTAVETIDTKCPSNGIVSSYIVGFGGKPDGGQQYFFKCENAANYKFNDIASFVAYSISDCIGACISTNLLADRKGGKQPCVGAMIDNRVRRQLKVEGANCWIKSRLDNGTKEVLDEGTVMRLCKTADCSSTYA